MVFIFYRDWFISRFGFEQIKIDKATEGILHAVPILTTIVVRDIKDKNDCKLK